MSYFGHAHVLVLLCDVGREVGGGSGGGGGGGEGETGGSTAS